MTKRRVGVRVEVGVRVRVNIRVNSSYISKFHSSNYTTDSMVRFTDQVEKWLKFQIIIALQPWIKKFKRGWLKIFTYF